MNTDLIKVKIQIKGHDAVCRYCTYLWMFSIMRAQIYCMTLDVLILYQFQLNFLHSPLTSRGSICLILTLKPNTPISAARKKRSVLVFTEQKYDGLSHGDCHIHVRY